MQKFSVEEQPLFKGVELMRLIYGLTPSSNFSYGWTNMFSGEV